MNHLTYEYSILSQLKSTDPLNKFIIKNAKIPKALDPLSRTSEVYRLCVYNIWFIKSHSFLPPSTPAKKTASCDVTQTRQYATDNKVDVSFQ